MPRARLRTSTPPAGARGSASSSMRRLPASRGSIVTAFIKEMTRVKSASSGMLQSVFQVIDIAFAASLVAVALATAGHALIYKRELRAATLWIVVCFALPAIGPVLYILLGINRVERRALRMRGSLERF